MVILELQPNTHRTKIRIDKKIFPVKLRNYSDTSRRNERKSKYPNSSISISFTYPSSKKHHTWILHEKNPSSKGPICFFAQQDQKHAPRLLADFYWRLSTYERFLIHRTVVEGFLRFLPTGHLKKMVGVGEPVG